MAFVEVARDEFNDAQGTNLDAHAVTSPQGATWALVGAGDLQCQDNKLFNDSLNPQFAMLSIALAAKQRVEMTITDRNAHPCVCLLMGIAGGNATGYVVSVNAAFGSELWRFTGSGATHATINVNGTEFANGDKLGVEYNPVTDVFTIQKDIGGGFTTIWTQAGSNGPTTGGVGCGMRTIGGFGNTWIAYEDTLLGSSSVSPSVSPSASTSPSASLSPSASASPSSSVSPSLSPSSSTSPSVSQSVSVSPSVSPSASLSPSSSASPSASLSPSSSVSPSVAGFEPAWALGCNVLVQGNPGASR